MQDKTLNFEQALKIANQAVFTTAGRYLTDVETAIFNGAWLHQTYEEMAANTEYTVNYLQRTVGHKFWKLLSEALGEEVSKSNFRTAIERKLVAVTPPKPTAISLEFPEGPVELDSIFYVERPSIESDCCKAILQPGALIRIKASRQMGKTSLLNRILDYAEKQNSRTVRLNLLQAEKAVFSNLDKFLRWFCAYITQKLELPPQLNDYWDEARGSIVSCTIYFQEHLLEQIDSPLVLALDEVDRVFQYPEIAQDFLPMLRSWHEEANNLDIWEQLRLVVVHSTEDYGKLDINQSPFNVGLPVELTEFTSKQVEDLARRHKMDWAQQVGAKGFAPLQEMVGGHPYLIRLAFYHLVRQGVTLEELLQDAATDAGIYNVHLRRYLETLKQYPELATALKRVVAATESVRLETMLAYKLYSMGLIKRQGDRVTPRCELYRHYFRDRLGNEG